MDSKETTSGVDHALVDSIDQPDDLDTVAVTAFDCRIDLFER